MTEVLECPICKGELFTHKANCIDYTVSQEIFHVKQCKNCELAITSPRPEIEKLHQYYQSDEYISHSGKSSSGIGTIYKLARQYALGWKKDLIKRFKAGNNILDFGCGTGEFISTFRKDGWQIAGVEPSEIAREKATVLSDTSIVKNIEQINQQKFDVITAWHVIEHVPNLSETIEKLKILLKQDGVIFIAVPNYQSPDSIQYKNFWAGYDVPRHLWHFSKKSMTQLLHSQGLVVLEIVPMKLDSYYISLLSEKYKNKNRLSILGIINAFISGFKSNFIARTQTNHSSLIYIAKIHEA
jgi:2-polyprenyl-3-methyl-5-hydroxy-6-metoxy-1,4-benzoquinol methylase